MLSVYRTALIAIALTAALQVSCSLSRADEGAESRDREIPMLISVVAGKGFYALRDPKEKAAIARLHELSEHAAPAIAKMLAEGLANRKSGWLDVYRPLYILSGMGEHAKIALPDIIKALDDDHPANVLAAARVLEQIGPPAKEALPKLVRVCAAGEGGNPQRAAAAAIQAIDPAFAEKLAEKVAEVPFPVPEGAPLIESTKGLISRIAFGSCGNQNKAQPILKHVIDRKPDLFCYLGDNIYGDSRTLAVLRAKYMKLAEKPEFQALRKAMPLIATWDDHDYGENDSGKEYVLREESKKLFLEFFREPEGTERWKRPGIYTSYVFAGMDRRVQMIVLDTRSFRDPLAKNPLFGREKGWKNDYHPDPNPEKTLLGKEQWEWLEDELKKPADVRIIASSIQFAHEYNGYESWTNLPKEQEKLLEVLRKTKANGVVFISGDVHWGELSVLNAEGLYPLHDVTSSGLTETWPTIEPNSNRFGAPVRQNNFGLIEIDWKPADPVLALQLIDVKGEVRVKKEVKLSELQVK